MKKMTARILAFILVFAMAFPITTVLTPETTASAAAVALTASKKTVVLGTTYTITLKDSSNVSKKAFKSSNTKIATVNGKGVVTPVAVGTAKITCTTTLKTGATVSLACTITVKKRVPATAIAFKNLVQDKINAHIIEAGDKYDFNMKITPTTSTDSCYFTITDSSIASVSAAGIVTAKKEGITTLEVRAGASAAGSKNSTVMAKTYIYVTPKVVVTPSPTPTPAPVEKPKATGIKMNSSQEVEVDFNTAIEKSSVIDKNGQLIAGAITITPGNNAFNYGTLSAKMTEDKKGVIISSTSEFNGNYVVTVFNKVLSADGQVVEPASFQTDYKDTEGPKYVGSTVAGNGYVCQVNFNEAIDISELQIISVNGTTNQVVKARLSTTSSYTLSPDKKSLTVDLSACGDKVINASVGMIGIKDLKGNASTQYQMSVIVRCDATDKPVAKIVSAERESKTAIKATFDQDIQYGGYIILDGNYLDGIVDVDNPKIVRYTLGNTAISGMRTVTITGYRNFNMVNSNANNQTISINFTLDTTPPSIMGQEMKSEIVNGNTVQSLVLTYNKNVSLINTNGSITTVVNNANADIYTTSLAYTATVEGKKLTMTFNSNALEVGNYTFTIPAGLVMDSLENLSAETKISTKQQMGGGNELPPPQPPVQDAASPNKINVTFNNKLDPVSAQTVTNYRVNDSIIPVSAMITAQSNTSATVELTFAPGAFVKADNYTIKITGVKGYNGTYGTMKEYNSYLSLISNDCPQVKSCKQTGSNLIQIELTKEVTGTGVFQVITSNGVYDCTSPFANGNIIFIALNQDISGSAMVKLITNNFKDANNNLANLPAQVAAQKAY